MVSNIDVAQPATGIPASKAEHRAFRQTAKDEIEALQTVTTPSVDANNAATISVNDGGIFVDGSGVGGSAASTTLTPVGEIEATDVQAGFAEVDADLATIANPSNLTNAIPSSALFAVGQGASPYHFVPDPAFIGVGIARKLNADFATEADARTAYPEVADLLPDGTDLSTVTHDWAAFQSMSRSVIKSGNGIPQQEIPTGVYDFSDTWKVLEGEAFNTGVVKGAGRGKGIVDAASAHLTMTALRSNFNDRPLVSIQGARHFKFSDLTLIGTNQTFGLIAGGQFAAKDPGLWTAPGVATHQHAPYTGIAVDPYTSDPVGFTKFPNDPYNRLTSSQIHIDHVHLQWFYVGFGVGLSLNEDLGDSVHIKNSDCNSVAYGCVSGGDQNRILSYHQGYMEGGFRCFDNRTFGRQDGNAFQCDDLVMVLFYELFDYKQVDPVTFSRVHLEQFVRLGTWRGGPHQFPLTMDNGHIKFFGNLEGTIHRPASLFLCEDGRAVFSATRFDTVPSSSLFFPGHFNFLSRDAGHIDFDKKCSFFQSALQPGRCSIGFNRFNANPPRHDQTKFNSGLASDLISLQITEGGLDDVQNIGNGSEGLRAGPRIGGGPRTHTINIRGRGLYRYVPGVMSNSALNGLPGLAVAGISNIVLSVQNTTHNATPITYERLSFDTTQPEMLRLNDDIAARLIEGSPIEGIIGYVEAITGNTIDVFLTVDSGEITQPFAALQVVVQPDWAPLDPLVGTCSTGSTTVTFPSDVSEIVFAGDFIQGADGNWNRYRVDSVDPSGVSIELNKNAPFTGATNMFWGRLFEITGTAV